jgi:TolA-binding protein
MPAMRIARLVCTQTPPAALGLAVAIALGADASPSAAQSLGRPVETVPDEPTGTYTISRSDSASPRSSEGGPGRIQYERKSTGRGSFLPKFEMPIWEYVYRKVRDPSADVHMIAPKGKAKSSSAYASGETIWAKMGRALGVRSSDPETDLVLADGAGAMRAVSADRRSDRYTNQEFLQAEEHFRREEYAKARRAFKALAKKYKDRPLEEDILFMKAECEFRLDWLPTAQDTYAQLLTKYPTTRYMPQAVQRTYDIAYYWLEDSRLVAEGRRPNHPYSRYVNLFDRTRPWLDVDGRALEAIELIQQYDPFGPLTDDAVMMAGAQSFTSDRFVQAATYYEQLVADQPQSEHAAKALFLSGQAYLRSYRGPQYDAADLDGAERMTRQALNRGEAYSPEQRRRLEADLRAIHVERAKRDFEAGECFRRRLRYTSAKFYYRQVIADYPDTDWARRAEERLRELGDKETQKLQLANLFQNPFGGLVRSSRLEADPFRDKAAATGSAPPNVGSARRPDDVDPIEEEPLEDEGEEKSRFNLRNWLDKF